MWRKTLLFVQVGLFALGAFGAQACYEENTYPAGGYYGPGYYSSPPPVVLGGYDEHQSWHDRDWWVSHDHQWVENHHHEWLEHHEAHEAHEHKG